MRRLTLPARPDWIDRVEEVGFTYHTAGESPENVEGTYWFEQAAYEFEAEEIDSIESASEELHARCLDAVDYAVNNPSEMTAFGLSPAWQDYVATSWRRQDPYWMGRFDLGYDPASGAIKMLEYNGDTPTLVIESSLVQWFWLQDTFPQMDQFNSLHEKLLSRITEIGQRIPGDATLHFAALPTYEEEHKHALYYLDLARQAGIRSEFVGIPDLGNMPGTGLVDANNQPIRFLHKLYPWEWLAQEEIAPLLLEDRVGVIEPAWKMLLSNKALLPLLWKMFPGHPNLLASYWSPEKLGSRYIAKPTLAREGANITLARPGLPTITTEGSYGDNPMIYQDVFDLPRFDGQHVVLGSWMVGQQAAGIIIRESENPVVVNTSKVVPHYFRPAA